MGEKLQNPENHGVSLLKSRKKTAKTRFCTELRKSSQTQKGRTTEAKAAMLLKVKKQRDKQTLISAAPKTSRTKLHQHIPHNHNSLG